MDLIRRGLKEKKESCTGLKFENLLKTCSELLMKVSVESFH
jgi:hypothetical protein